MEPHWTEKLNKMSGDNCIDYIYPGHDDVIMALAVNIMTIPCDQRYSQLDMERIAYVLKQELNK